MKRIPTPDCVEFAIESLPPLAELERSWRELDRTGTHSFFTSWPWIGTVLRTCTRKPMLLRAMRGKRLAGMALLTVANARFKRLLPIRQAWLNATGDPRLDTVTIEHNGFAVPAGTDAALVPALVDWVAQGGIAVDELVLPGLGCVSPDSRSLLLVEQRTPGYRTALSGIADEGLAPLLSRNARQQLRRSLRDYGGRLSLDRAGDVQTALGYFSEMKTLHIRSWTRRGRGHAFLNPFFEEFHRSMIETALADGGIDLLRISSNDTPIGYLYNFRRNGIVASYQSGFADDQQRLRPGYVCHALAMAQYAQEGMQYYDFLAGSNQLKRSFGLEIYELCWNRYRKPTPFFIADDLLRKIGRRVRRQIKGE